LKKGSHKFTKSVRVKLSVKLDLMM